MVKIYFFIIIFLAIPMTGRAVSPMGFFNSLLAGGDEAGFNDGSFVKARFNHPVGLSLDETGAKLFVADSGNHRIRCIDLNNNNDVQTLAGTDEIGSADGSLETASFKAPTRLARLPGNNLAVYDAGSHSIRLLDLKNKKVTTLAQDLSLWDMVYRSEDNSLYFSNPDTQTLNRLDLKSLSVLPVLFKNKKIPSPQALCVSGGKFYIADKDLPTVYEVSFGDAKAKEGADLVLKEAGQANGVLALSYSDKYLYALQTGMVPIVRVGSPQSTPVSLATPWGFLIESQDPQVEPFMSFQPNQPVGFVVSPRLKEELFIAQPRDDSQTVISVKDYRLEDSWTASITTDSVGSNRAMDYYYPPEKPANTFRILLPGDSRTYIAPRVIPGSLYDLSWFYGAPRSDTMAKQLELFLNTEAAARGVKTHFEVLEWNRQGLAFSTYAYYEIPPLVKKYHIDMVLAMVGWAGYYDYFMNPMTKEGIPSEERDYEYILKPLSQRIPPGAAEDLYKHYKLSAKGNTEKFAWPGQDNAWEMTCSADPDIRRDMIELTGRRVQMMGEKIDAMNVSASHFPHVVLFYVPQRNFPSDCVADFWKELSEKSGFPFMDIADGYKSLKIEYYPAATECCDGHYTAYGSKLIGYLLSHYLIEDKLIPFDVNGK
jgi:hypothetical protein